MHRLPTPDIPPPPPTSEQSRNVSLAARINHVEMCLKENRDSMREFFRTCYQTLLWQIFNFDDGASGRGLHSSTSQLNVSVFCGIGGVLRGCVGGFTGCQGVLGRVTVLFRVINGSG